MLASDYHLQHDVCAVVFAVARGDQSALASTPRTRIFG
jgi:hypothetical protein